MRKLVNINLEENIIYDNVIHEYNTPDKVYIKSSFGEINDYLYKNEFINDEIVSVSGYITNKSKNYIEVTNDFKENIKTKQKKYKINKVDELLKLLLKYNLNNIYEKINDKIINNIIISSVDKEVYEEREFIRLLNFYDNLLDTAEEIIKIFKVNKLTFAIKNTNSNSINNINSVIGSFPNIKILLLPDEYLIGKKEFLCEYLNINKLNTLILTTNELYDIYRILYGIDLTKNLITISGDIEKSLIINTKLGVRLTDLIKEYNIKLPSKKEIYINGYFCGYKESSINNVLINKSIHSIIIKEKKNIKKEECIKCSACNKICPYKINVYKNMLNNTLCDKCIGCNLCTFICPANIDLKSILYKGGQK